MSVFKVKLQTNTQGRLDIDPSTDTSDAFGMVGDAFGVSKQRTIYVAGPNRIYRKLHDGDTFTDCNYWKRYVHVNEGGGADDNTAFLTFTGTGDDGSIYSDVASENTFPRVYDRTVAFGDTWEDQEIDILGDTGGYAIFTQITNGSGEDIKVRLNGDSNATFDLSISETQVFNAGELSVSKIQFDNTVSGSSSTVVQVLVSVKSVCHS